MIELWRSKTAKQRTGMIKKILFQCALQYAELYGEEDALQCRKVRVLEATEESDDYDEEDVIYLREERLCKSEPPDDVEYLIESHMEYEIRKCLLDEIQALVVAEKDNKDISAPSARGYLSYTPPLNGEENEDDGLVPNAPLRHLSSVVVVSLPVIQLFSSHPDFFHTIRKQLAYKPNSKKRRKIRARPLSEMPEHTFYANGICTNKSVPH